MANKPLKTIKFPGLDDTYTIPQVDTTLAVSGAAADAKKTGDELSDLKQDFNEYHPDLGSGYSAQLLSTVFIEDEVPYNFRTSGGSADIVDREYDEIVGVSMPINQLAPPYSNTYSYNGITISCNESGQYTITVENPAGYAQITLTDINVMNNHVYLCVNEIKGLTGSQLYISSLTAKNGTYIVKSGISASKSLFLFVPQTAPNGTYSGYVGLCDLTLALGETIANYVYNLESATAGTGVTWLKHHFQKIFDSGYIPFNAGEIQSVSGLSSHKMIGFNQWNEQWENCIWNEGANGAKQSNAFAIGSKDYIPALPSTTYCLSRGVTSTFYALYYDANKAFLGYNNLGMNTKSTFTTPEGCHFITFYSYNSYGTTYNHDICINLHWDGERDGQYEEYKEYEYALDDSLTLRGILKLDSSNQLYADGDRYLADGTVERRFGVVDLGTLDWVYVSSGSVFAPYFYVPIPNMKQPTNIQTAAFDIICDKYVTTPRVQGTFVSGCICADVSGSTPQIQIIDTTYTGSSAFKTAMSGVKLVYPLKTPTTETAEPYQTPQIVDDWGTEEYVSTSLVPVGHDTKYANNLRAKLEMSPDSPEEDGDYIVRHNNGENQYVALGSTTTIQGILDRLTALENA